MPRSFTVDHSNTYEVIVLPPRGSKDRTVRFYRVLGWVLDDSDLWPVAERDGKPWVLDSSRQWTLALTTQPQKEHQP